MLKPRRISLNRFRKERREDLSILTGLPFSSLKTRSTSSGHSKRKRVRFEYDFELRQQFLEARARALAHTEKKITKRKSKKRNSSSSPTSFFHRQKPDDEEEDENSQSLYFNETSKRKLESSSGSSGQTTIKCVPKLVSASDCKVARMPAEGVRGILKPSKVNCQPVKPRTSETDYWTSFRTRYISNLGKKSGGHPIHSLDMAKTSTRRGWNAFSSGPITKAEASRVQQCFSGSSTSGSTASSMPLDYGHIGCGPNIFESPSVSIQPPMSLLNSIRPPGSAQATTGYGGGGTPSNVLISDWMSRENMRSTPTQVITKNYSVAQLMDILCGYANPTESDLAGYMFKPTYDPPQPRPQTPFYQSTSFIPSPIENQNFLSNHPSRNVPGISSFGVKNDENSSGLTRSRQDNTDIFSPSPSPNVPEVPESPFPANFGRNDFSSIFDLGNQCQNSKFGATRSSNSNFFEIGEVHSTPAKKSVSFLTDSDDNITVTEHYFDRFNSSESSLSLNTLTPPKMPLGLLDGNTENQNELFPSDSQQSQIKLNLFSTYDSLPSKGSRF